MLTEAVAGYVALRRAAGFSFNTQAAQLKSFAAFSEAKGEHRVRAQIAIKWASLAPSVPQRARRLGVVIRFSRHLHTEDERHEIPPSFFGAERRPRRVPYIRVLAASVRKADFLDARDHRGGGVRPSGWGRGAVLTIAGRGYWRGRDAHRRGVGTQRRSQLIDGGRRRFIGNGWVWNDWPTRMARLRSSARRQAAVAGSAAATVAW